ncbi:hypothetical protein KBX06_01915 [Micromonospora sp. C31]|uniref:hypothetical protein n=1 Tax=Micromonospora sp. C31 TaxID=2824876 RepID=UPI001B35D87B|nr:hypothetical protein [Micromonospora sp. C31]MBQ1071927.1 hypothetical protein [Micromonospora sp. C31]
MTTVLVFLGAVVALTVAVFVVVGWRDRRRSTSAEDAAAARAATSVQERYAAERHGVQGEVWRSGQTPNG